MAGFSILQEATIARNGSGTYSVPNTFVSGNSITASGHNQNWTDIAAEITNSVAADGQTTMTGPLKAANGTAGAPSITFGSDTDSGFYRKAANSVALSLEGVDRVVWTTANASFAAAIIASATANFVVGFVASATANFAGEIVASATATFTSIGKFTSTSHLELPTGTTGQRPGTPAANNVRYNSTTGALEYYNGSAWVVPQTSPPVAGSFKKLSIKVASNTTVTVAADFVTTTDGALYQTTALSGTCDLGANGAVNRLDTGTIAIDTSYAIWAIAKADGTTGTLASTSFTAPTMPTGYTYKARIGAVSTIHGSATLYGTWQLGRRAQYIVGLAQTAALPVIANAVGGFGTYNNATPTWAATTVAGNGFFVPTTASMIGLVPVEQFKAGAGGSLQIAPNNSYGGFANTSGLAPPFDTAATTIGSLTFWMMLESTAIYAASTANAGPAILCLGWEDNI